MKNKLILKIFLSLFSLIATLLIIEFILRYYRIGDDERNLLYQHDSDLGWFPQPNLSRDFTGDVKININHNSLGFRDDEFIDNPNNKNLVFIGDSFAYGYDSEIHNRFSELVAKSLTNYDVLPGTRRQCWQKARWQNYSFFSVFLRRLGRINKYLRLIGLRLCNGIVG